MSASPPASAPATKRAREDSPIEDPVPTDDAGEESDEGDIGARYASRSPLLSPAIPSRHQLTMITIDISYV